MKRSAALQVRKNQARERMERRLSQAGPKKGGDTKFEFRFNTNEGRVFECYVTLSEDLQLWMSVLPQLSSEVIRGWLHKRKAAGAHSPKPTPDRTGSRPGVAGCELTVLPAPNHAAGLTIWWLR